MGPNVLGVYATVQHNENLNMLSGLSETWVVDKSQYYNFVMTPQISFIFTFFKMLPYLLFGVTLTLFGSISIIDLNGEDIQMSLLLLGIGLFNLFLSLTVRQKEIFLDLDNGYFVWRFVNWPRFRNKRYKLFQPFSFKVRKNSRGVSNSNRMAGYDFVVMDENEKEIPLIFFRCDQNPNKEFPIITKTLEDSIGMRRLFDGAENR